ncbi:hypothetical protein D9619_008423 [Psilocybe cf. subviscida]|uniref:Uncharacterized protein n=1 Tax=Psilocybe cf. subviscida TaxID=2480587 RepID=A0A8H5B9W5_9AGAR|nr:hypothetical protein D9619_008423 [Psilocybe cf. subviscida]
MDPLSVTLAVVSLATAVKDMVELGQKMHESFAKVSKNLLKAQRVAKDIKEMVEKIKIFYDNHMHVLDNMESFRAALLGLLDKFRSFETSILPLLPKSDQRRLGLFIRGWLNNNKIQENISDLQSDIVEVILKYTMDSTMRTEVKLETLHQDVTEGLQVLEVVRRDVSALRTTTATTTMTHYWSESSGTSDELNRNIIMFAKSTPSTSAPMLRTPNVITEELMTTAYIRLQFDSIAMIVEKMSIPLALPTTDITSNRNLSLRLVPGVEEGSMDLTRLRHHIVRQVTHARDLLESERVHTDPIHHSTLALGLLSFGLRKLGMHHECILVVNWAIILSRMSMLAGVSSSQLNCAAHLALYLLYQSVNYDAIGNTIQSLQAVQEAYTITQNLQNYFGTEVHFQILYADILLQYAELVNNKQAMQMSVEAVLVLENILNVQAFTQSTLYGKIEMVVQPSSSFIDHLFLPAPSIPVIQKSAVDLVYLAIALRQKIVYIHGQEYRVDLVYALSSLVQGNTANLVPAEELLVMTEECTQLLWELVEKNHVYYARELVNVLWEKASTLERLDRDTEAIATWEQIASLAVQIIQDSALYACALGYLSRQFRRLKRHDDAMRTGKLAIATYHEKAETRAERYFYLSTDLWQLRHYKEAVEAAQTSVTLYRHLATRDPERWTGNLTQGISDLAHCLAALGNYGDALATWKESVSMISSFLDTHPTASSHIIDKYCGALSTHIMVGLITKDDEECLKICSTTVQYLRRLLEVGPQNESITLTLFSAECHYAYNMIRVGHPLDAQHYLDSCLNEWKSTQEVISGFIIARWHATMLNLKVDALDVQGCTKQALLATQNVHNLVKPFVSTFQPCFVEMIESMHRKARLQGNLGNSAEALQVAEEALQLARNSRLMPIIDGLVWSLHAVAITALLHGDYNRAAEAAREGCNIFNSPEGLEFEENDDDKSLIRPSLISILSSAEANLGRCGTAIDYANRAVDLALEIEENKLYIPATTAEHCYMETRGNLAEILFATGDLAQAREICQERSAYFFKRVEKRMGEYRDLAPILRMLGILCCSEGRHDEGDAAAQELCRIIKMLGSAFSSLQKQVKIRLHHQAQVPILKALGVMSESLDCKHQREVVSLFSI